jgi:hypothetical protein
MMLLAIRHKTITTKSHGYLFDSLKNTLKMRPIGTEIFSLGVAFMRQEYHNGSATARSSIG